jgi:hypothetical protein
VKGEPGKEGALVEGIATAHGLEVGQEDRRRIAIEGVAQDGQAMEARCT